VPMAGRPAAVRGCVPVRGWLRVSGVRRCERPSVGSSALAALPAATAKADRSREAFQRLMGRFGQPGRQASLVCLCRSVLHWDARCARISCVSHARSGCCWQLRAVFFVHRVVHVNCLTTAIAITEPQASAWSLVEGCYCPPIPAELQQAACQLARCRA
jgi:hypothetical protein